ncbi:Uncharacterised protein [Vibrio cholerae]|uniref:Uncharacterized protein n=1 Tax=Vibrio cholerae TaxID=666 RepID=A0A655X3S2_VIBCL|nr:Uncharacterised protein [Vibrio cholerae]
MKLSLRSGVYQILLIPQCGEVYSSKHAEGLPRYQVMGLMNPSPVTKLSVKSEESLDER